MTHWTQQQTELRILRDRIEALERENLELVDEVIAQEARYVDLIGRYDDLRAKHRQQFAVIERYQQRVEETTRAQRVIETGPGYR